MNSDTEILFPIRVIPSLRDLRGDDWRNLIDQLTSKEVEQNNLAAFSLMMARLGGCAGCNADSFRAMRGCTLCARLTIKRFKGKDGELLELYRNACKDVAEFMSKYE